jgi:hypothetical protein
MVRPYKTVPESFAPLRKEIDTLIEAVVEAVRKIRHFAVSGLLGRSIHNCGPRLSIERGTKGVGGQSQRVLARISPDRGPASP